MKRLTLTLLASLLLVLPAAAQQVTTPPGAVPSNGAQWDSLADFSGSALTTAPCDLIAGGGCASAYSVVGRMVGKYVGPLFTLWRASDGTTRTFYAQPASLFVYINGIHNFCDGTDCYFSEIYDQAGPNNATNPNPAPTQYPLLIWAANGLPIMDEYAIHSTTAYLNDIGTGIAGGGFLTSAATTNLPTTGSRTMYLAADNSQWSDCCDNFGYSGEGSLNGNGFTFITSQTNANSQTSTIFGINGEGYNYTYGAYPSGYAQIIGLAKYNAANSNVLTQILPSSCMPNGVSLCSAFTTYNGAPTFSTDVSNNGQPVYVHFNYGTDTSTPGGHFQSGMIVAKATTPVEDAVVMQALAAMHFPVKPNPCATVSSSLSASNPNTVNSGDTGSPIVPNSYYGVPTPNLANAVGLWSTSLVNPYYNGPLFRVVRADTGAGTDIYALGCDADAGAVTTALSGTTGTVSVLYDQSGHGWNAFQPYQNMQPALSASGMNSKACLQFTPVTASTFTATASSSGVLNVTTTPTTALAVGQALSGSGYPNRAIITAQLTGTAGGIGTYAVPAITGNIGSETVTAHLDPFLNTDVVWPNASGHANNGGIKGLAEGMTLEAAFQTTSSLTSYGVLASMGGGWWLGNNSTTANFNFAKAGVSSYVTFTTSTWNFTQAHFGYLTADASATQNLAISIDNLTAVTATDTAQAAIGGDVYYTIGTAIGTGNPWKGCIGFLAIYNDVESSTNLTAAYNMAHQKWATP